MRAHSPWRSGPLAAAIAALLALTACSARDENTPVDLAAGAACRGVQLSWVGNATVLAGTVTLEATGATCAVGESPEYRFSYKLNDTDTFTLLRTWAPASTVDWDTTGLPSGQYSLRVEARAGSRGPRDSRDTRLALVGNVCPSVTMTHTPQGTHPEGTVFTFTAQATCNGGTPQYRFEMRKAKAITTYTVLQDWSPNPVLNWDTAGERSRLYEITVYARSGTNPVAESEFQEIVQLGEVCGGLTASVVPMDNAPAGTNVQVLAAAACTGTAGARYRFSYRPAGTTAWTVFQNWNARNSATWNTNNVPVGQYSIGVEVRADDYNQGGPQDAVQLPYALTGNCGTVTLSTSLPSPQALGTPVDLTALAVCASGTPEYKFIMAKPGDPTPVVLRDWAAGRTFTVTSNEVGRVGLYTFKVESRALGQTDLQGQAFQDFTFLAPCDAAGFDVVPPGPQPVGTTVQVLAQASCVPSATAEFLLSYRPIASSTWTAFYGWDSPGMGAWDTTGLASGSYQLRAEIRDAGNPTGGTSTVFLPYDLTCPAGYAPDVSSGLCVDIDECAMQACDPQVTCTNTPGSYSCGSCPAGTIDVNGDSSVCTTIAQVSAGWGHSCATTEHGQLYCWGNNDAGQLGDGTTTSSSQPVRVGTNSDWDSVAVSYYFSCGLRSGSLYCWGWNVEGQLGNGTMTDSLVPVQVGIATDWVAIDLGYYHACGLRGLLGGLYCWGYGGDGELGNGGTASISTPVPVGAVGGWGMFAVGGYHGCGIHSGILLCWGDNSEGQLGDTTFTNSSSPVPVGSDGDWSSVTAGGAHSCGLRNGSLYCWGWNDMGQLGDGTVIGQPVPVPVGSAMDWTSVVGGANHSCGTRGGSLHCWGANAYGQLGDGSNLQQTTPVAVGVATDWLDISGGDFHTCGVRGTDLHCWGWNDAAQLGDGTTTNRNVPGSPISF